MSIGEALYGRFSRAVLATVNPFKKFIVATECKVHQEMNRQAVEIIKNDGYMNAYAFFQENLGILNLGVIWADQDFKSINHFYHPYERKGLYGHKNALTLAEDYYRKAREYWESGRTHKSLFYLGATAHLVQDVTIPQHVNIRLLGNHRQYETFVKKTYQNSRELRAVRGAIEFDRVKEFVQFNARVARKSYQRLHTIPRRDERFFRIARCMIPLAERTTAGLLLMFYHRNVLHGKRKMRI